MTEPRVELVGADAAMADLKRWADELGPAVAKAAEPFADRVADVVRGKVPVISGQLAGSVATSSTDDGVGVGYDGSAEYAGWVEFGGTRGRPYMPDGRWLYPTAEASSEEFAKVAADTATDTAGRFAWSTPTA